MADKTTRDSENIMPHNPLKSRELFAEVKDKIKGSLSWLEFDLRCIAAYLKATNSGNKAIEDALARLEQAAKTPAPAKEKPAAKPQAKKETPATNATKKPGEAAPTPATGTGPKKTKDTRKTPAEIKAAKETKAAKEAAAAAGNPADDTPPTTDETAELADIK